MSPDDVIAQLAPIRLPADFTRFGPMDALVGFALGVLVALALRTILPVFAVRNETQLAMTRRRIAALAGLDAEERVFYLALLLRDVAPGRGVDDAALYNPDVMADPEGLEREILAFARSDRRRR